ncbi:MAG: DUF4340 domain-containing protein [Saprospiraceae bacterium]|nr:DUF4340 domain-containing protein [Saprospiraceae bacterium]MDZ4703883.1 DUF4340 domain-containing protein [Saprospiraceae bacterium]
MKRTLWMLVAFLILGAGVLWYLYGQGDDKTTLAGLDRQFAVKDTASIYKIFIADRKGNRTTLERKGKHWLYNDQYKAKPNAIENLLRAIYRVEMKYKPPINAEQNMIRSLATEGLKVELYDAKNRLIKSYYIGGSTADERGTYMMLDGVEQPYVTYIPSWSGNLRFRFNLLDDEWRDKSIFSLAPEEITYVGIEYHKQREKSFKITKEGASYQVKPFHSITPEIKRPLRTGAVESYLVGYENLQSEAFENLYKDRDSISSLVPFCTITVRHGDGTERVAKLHPIFKLQEYDEETKKYIESPEAERYYVDCEGDFMMAQHIVLKKILWPYESFFK